MIHPETNEDAPTPIPTPCTCPIQSVQHHPDVFTLFGLSAIGICLLASIVAALSSAGRGRSTREVRHGARPAGRYGDAACGSCGHIITAQDAHDTTLRAARRWARAPWP